MASTGHSSPDVSTAPSGEGGEKGKVVARRHLIDRLNYLNFQDQPLIVNLKHARFDSTISLQAKPLPCRSEILDCVWSDIPDLGRLLAMYRPEHILIPDGRQMLFIDARVIGMDEQRFSLQLPDFCREVSTRKKNRHPGNGITALLVQNGTEMRGALRNFNATSFRVELSDAPDRAFHWIDEESPVHLSFSNGRETLFSGECRIVNQRRDGTARSMVLEPMHHRLHRYKPRIYRSTRQKLDPSPWMECMHPFMHHAVSLKVVDISGSGFSVEEEEENSLLLPGLILPQVDICFADNIRIACMAQVLYRSPCPARNGRAMFRCGLAILDMERDDRLQLFALLSQAAGDNTHLCGKVDVDALWRFFFDSGFISPEKYASFNAQKEEIKETYRRLYSQPTDVACHIVYQDRGRILGHIAMVRLYEKSWLIHHHTSVKHESLKAGLTVLSQVSRYVNDVHRFRSSHMEYVFCYYRPNNRFPQRVFGEFANTLNDPNGCSLDTFAYFHHRLSEQGGLPLPHPWELADARPSDIEEFKIFYRHRSGGLMPEAFDLSAAGDGNDALGELYRSQGFKKERHLYSLNRNGVPRALLLANVTNAGLNLSNLTNCVTAVVMDDALPPDVLRAALSSVAARYEGGGMPVLLYPDAYAERHAIVCEKRYSLWILDLQYLDQYFKFCSTLFRYIQKPE
jgi:hypothetical protein